MTDDKEPTTECEPSTTQSPLDRKLRPGFISHTDIASEDPEATKAWCTDVLGWAFQDPMPMGEGAFYHMWDFGNNQGGGIAAKMAPEQPAVTPFCEVPDIQTAFDEAIEAGATEMMAPDEIPGGQGWLAIVMAPGNVPIGFWAPK
jgi:predicted enzyme related to lactoylglutathione lyase